MHKSLRPTIANPDQPALPPLVVSFLSPTTSLPSGTVLLSAPILSSLSTSFAPVTTTLSPSPGTSSEGSTTSSLSSTAGTAIISEVPVTPPTTPHKASTSFGLIAGVVAGVVVALVIIVCYAIFRRRRRIRERGVIDGYSAPEKKLAAAEVGHPRTATFDDLPSETSAEAAGHAISPDSLVADDVPPDGPSGHNWLREDVLQDADGHLHAIDIGITLSVGPDGHLLPVDVLPPAYRSP